MPSSANSPQQTESRLYPSNECLAYSDDIELMAESKEYVEEWDLRFSEKNEEMEFRSECRNQWLLKNNVLEIADKYVNLGIEVNKGGTGEKKQENK